MQPGAVPQGDERHRRAVARMRPRALHPLFTLRAYYGAVAITGGFVSMTRVLMVVLPLVVDAAVALVLR